MQSGMARGRGRSGRGGTTTSSLMMQAAHVGQLQARVYAITRQEAHFHRMLSLVHFLFMVMMHMF